MSMPEKDRIGNGKTPQKLARRAHIILLIATGVPTGH